MPLNLSLLPNALPYPVVAVTSELAALPENQIVSARIVMRSSQNAVVLDATLPLHEINNQRLTLSYAPATLEDHRLSLAFGGLDAVPLYLIQLRPQLSLSGKVRASGSAGVDAGADLLLDISLNGPFGSTRVSQSVLAGAFHALGIASDPTRPAQALPGDADSPGAGLLDGIALAYQQQWRAGETALAGLSGVRALSPVPSVLLVSNQMQVVYLGDAPHTLAWQGVTLDALSHPLEVVSAGAASSGTGTAASGAADFMALSGLHGSSLESLLFQRQFGVDAISADRALALARAQNLPILTLGASNAASIDASNHSAAVKAHIRNLLRLGYRVEVPASRQSLSAWQGSGWRALDAASGASGYFISGSLAGGATATPAEAWTLGFLADALRNPNADPFNSDPLSGVSMLKLGAGDGQIQTVGMPLDEPLSVLVQDKDGMPVKGAAVRFQVVTGGGRFGESAVLETTTSSLGIARAPLTLGTNTNNNPVYANLNQGDTYPARMSWHVIDVSAQAKNGVLHIDTPFTAVARPDVLASLRRSTPERQGGLAATWADTLGVMSEDRHGNPVPNVALNFAISTKQGCTGTGGDQHFRPGVLFDPSIGADGSFVYCPSPHPHLGDCGNNLLVQHSSSLGSAFAGVILSNDGKANNQVEVSAGGRKLNVSYLAGGTCGPSGAFLPVIELTGKLIDANGVSVSAASPRNQYKPDMVASLSYTSMPYEVRDNKLVFFPFVSYVPTRGDAAFVVDGDGYASGQRQAGVGRFFTKVNMGSIALNHKLTVNASNIEILYPVLIDHVVQIERAVSQGSIDTRDLYAVTSAITKLVTDDGGNKIVLDVGGNNANNLLLQYNVQPASYTALAVDIDLYEDGKFKNYFVGSQLSGPGAILIPRGQPFDVNKVYEVELVLNRGTLVEIRSPKFRLELRQKLISSAFARSARLDVDVLNKRACDRPGGIFYSFTQDVLASLTIVPLDAAGNPNGAERVLFKDKPYAQGSFDYQLSPAELGSGDFRFELNAVGVRDPAQKESSQGSFSVLLKATNSLPVGQVIVKGVKVKDGGMSVQSQALSSAGRGPALHFQPSYSTGANGQIGLMGTNWSHNFESSLNINSCGEVLVSAGDGGTVRFFPTNDGKLVPDLGYHATLERNDADHSFDFFSKDGTRYHYKFINERLQWMVDLIEDTNGNTLSLTYDMQALPEPRLVSVLARDGREFKFSYLEQDLLLPGGSGKQAFLAQVRGPGGLAMDFTHDASGNLTEVNRNGRIEKYSYNTSDSNVKLRALMLGSTDPNGNQTTYRYNQASMAFDQGSSHIVLPNSMVTSITTPTGRVAFDIDTTSFKKTSVTDENGNITRYLLNDYGNPLTIIDPAGTTSMSWASDDINMLSKTDARGVVTTYNWDKSGNLLSETTAGVSISNTWLVQSNRPWIKNKLLSHTDRNGNLSQYTLDGRGNRLAELLPAGGTVQHSYAGNGDLLQTIDGNGGATRFEWDASGNLTGTLNPVGAKIRMGRDGRGRMTLQTDGNGNTTTYAYDAQDRLKQQTNALGDVRRMDWDANGNKMQETDEAGHITNWTYSALNLPTSITRADGSRKTLVYDNVGNKTGESDYRGNITSYGYDGVNRLILRTEPLGKTTRYGYDAVGNLVSETDALGRITYHSYNALSQRISTTDTGGGQWQMSYDGNGNKVSSTDPLGRNSRFSYDGQNRLTLQSLPQGHTTRHTWDANGNQTSETDANGATTQYRYDGANRLIQVLDKNGKPVSHGYDKNNNLTRTIDQNLNSLLFTWDALNRKTSSKDGASYVTTWSYDPVGNLAGEVLPNGNAIGHTYDNLNRRVASSDNLGTLGSWAHDADGNLTSETDANGHTSSHDYNALNQKTGSRLPANRTLGFEYDLLGNRTGMVDANGNHTVFGYDNLNRLSSTVDAKGGTHAVQYDAVGNKVGETDPNGNVTTWNHDALNRVTSVVDALGKTISYQYDTLGNKTGEVNKRGVASSFTYDPMQRLLSVSKDGTLIVQNRYDDVGNLIGTTDANGNSTSIEYDRRNLRIAENRPLAAITRFGLDAMGDVLTSTDPEGRVSAQTFDVRRRVLSSSNGAGDTTQFSYDGVGNRTSTTHPAGNRTEVQYDDANRAISVKDAAGSTRYTYDPNGNHLRVTDANGNSTSYGFDQLNRRTSISYPGGASESFAYDKNGNLTTHVDGNGISVSHTWDALNRETGKTFSSSADGLSSISTSYDPNNNVVSVVQAMAGGSQRSSYSYDNFDRLQGHTDPFGARAITSYDPNGNKTSMITQDGKVSRYSYDALNRLVNLSGQSGAISYTWDRSGLNTGMAYSNGVTSSTRFDAAKRIQSVLHAKGSTALSRTEYEYDKNSNRTRETINRAAGAQSTSYRYDATDRLTQTVLTEPNQTVTTTYELDAVGNRSKETTATRTGSSPASEISKSYRYDGRNQLTGISDSSAGDTTLSYDNQGNLIRKTRGSDLTQYAYNARDNLISVSKNATLLGSYTNDHLGLRVEKEAKDPQQPNAPPIKLRTLWDGRNAFQDSDTSGQVQARYENNGRHPVSMWSKNDGNQALHQDALGSIVATTDSSGALKSETIYDAFGNITTQTGSSANKFGYTGHQMDNETGLIYFQARYYDPQLGRFITQDPFEGDWMTPMSLHHYLYAYGNPTVYIDLNGYASFDEVKAGSARFAGGVAGAGVGILSIAQGTGQLIKDGIGEHLYNNTFGLVGRESHENNEKLRAGIKQFVTSPIETSKAVGQHFKSEVDLAAAETDRGNNFGGGAIAGKTAFDIYAILRTLPEIAHAASKVPQAVNAANAARRARVAGEIAEAAKPASTAAPTPPAKSAVENPADTIREAASGPNASLATKSGEKATPTQKTAEPERTPCSCCFAAGTPVLTESGFKPIEDIRVGDLVASKNEETGEQAFKPVTDLILTKHKAVYELILRAQNGGIETLIVTDNHPFWVLNKSKIKGKQVGWVDSAKLMQGMRVQTHEGKTLTVLALVAKHSVQPTFNFTVADFHTYFVGNGKAWVHNCAKPCSASQTGTSEESTIRVRHYTNRKGAVGIEESGTILAKDNNRVYVEPASKKPLSQLDAEKKYQIKPGRGRDYIETDVAISRLEWVKNPRYGTPELTVKGDLPLQNPEIIKRK